MMTPSLRKFVLTAHVTFSVGWFGAVVVFLALSITALTSQNDQMTRVVYLAAEPMLWFVIVPLAFISLITGIVQALGTTWGLFRHYWVLVKFVLTILATLVLLSYTRTVSYFASIATATDSLDSGGLPSYILHSGGGALVLIGITVLSVYKPRGMTPYGWRKYRQESP